ncbi:ArsR/SmtB family transcription factor [Yinghuangia seranimata]|uniref:ArsR/SmtB family transcription factor n=1 Tax=Yinghuangia seranimata TaxID=408067 RepID=UPI00248BE52B|nr:helix-turn-helix domain-containing protein [Yinghuangia seranimata]MDI2126227.1 helix-turn-helix domain-containing protein [Yinghuangia seranimata]
MPNFHESPFTRDAEALKVFTHPLRVRIFRLVYSEGPLTASALAPMVDATPSLVSYHLRTLAKYGYIGEDPEASTDGRERYWRALKDLRFTTADFADDPAGAEAAFTVAGVLQADSTRMFREAMARLRDMSPPWQDAAFGAHPTLRLTAAELQSLFEDLIEVVDRYRDRPESTEDGEPRERVLLQMLGFPYQP